MPKRPTKQPHFSAVSNPKDFATAYTDIGVAPVAMYWTAAGTLFTAEAGKVRRGRHKGDDVIVFKQNRKEMARAYSCCWGYKTNCNRTYIDSYTPAV